MSTYQDVKNSRSTKTDPQSDTTERVTGGEVEELDAERKRLAASTRLDLQNLSLEQARTFLEERGGEKMRRISPQEERAMGELSRRNLRATLGAVACEDTALIEEVQKRLDQVVQASGYSGSALRLELLESDMPVGAMHPGGTITLTTGLISRVVDGDALSGILAHEVVHQLN